LVRNTRPKIEFSESDEFADKTKDANENQQYERELSEEMKENEDEIREILNRQQEQLRDYEKKVCFDISFLNKTLYI